MLRTMRVGIPSNIRAACRSNTTQLAFGPKSPCLARRAFSILELCVVLGVILILVSLALPSLSRARDAARQLGDSVSASQYAKLITQYAGDHKDLFPAFVDKAYKDSVWIRSGGWGLELERAGLLNQAAFISPGEMPYKFTYAAFVDPKVIEPGRVPLFDDIVPTINAMTSVRYPSAKGMLWPVRRPTDPVEVAWCCGVESAPGSIAFVDGSVAVYRWHDMAGPDGIQIELWAGYPVISTWYGIFGKDRRAP